MVLCERAMRCSFPVRAWVSVLRRGKVSMMLCTFSGMVNCDFKAAAAAWKEDMPMMITHAVSVK